MAFESLVKRFWWDTKVWRDTFKVKEQEGLVFHKFRDFNIALVSKLAWRMGRMDDSLSARIFCAKYL